MTALPSLAPPRGMRDFYPEDMAVRNAVFAAWTEAAQRFGFQPYDACVVESLELLTRKAGEEIRDQIYAFRDKSDRELALRPEMTPTLARMIAARQNELTFPLKWYTIAQCFRYERMARGRKREHYQWNLDIVGEPAILAEAEVIAAALHALRLLGLGPTDVRVHVSSRALLADLFSKLGIPAAHHAATFLALDKRGKLADDAIAALLAEAGLSPRQVDAAFQALRLTSLDAAAALLDGVPPSLERLRELLTVLATYGVQDAVVFDISVIRGLAYYTGIVFEGYDAARALRAIFGGGRYDNLVGTLGGRPLTAVGLGFGDVVIAELLAEKGKLPAAAPAWEVALGYMEDAQRTTAVTIAAALRAVGRRVDLGLHAEKARHFFARVGKAGGRYAMFIGPDDVQKGTVRLKDLAQRTEREVTLAWLQEHAAEFPPQP